MLHQSEPTAPIDCAVIIVNYNGGKLLAEAVQSALLTGASRVVVVDNASHDQSLAYLSLLVNDAALEIVINARNLGFATACNIGASKVDNNSLLFLNPDARLLPEALQNLHEVLWSEPDIGMAGPLLLNENGTEQRGGRRSFPTLSSGIIATLRQLVPNLLSDEAADFNLHNTAIPSRPTDVDAISGGCMMVRRQALVTVGGWDESYFLHVEDIDLCKRFALAGLRNVFVPSASVKHLQGVSSRSRPYFVEWHKHMGMVRYHRKFHFSGELGEFVYTMMAVVRYAIICISIAIKRMRMS